MRSIFDNRPPPACSLPAQTDFLNKDINCELFRYISGITAMCSERIMQETGRPGSNSELSTPLAHFAPLPSLHHPSLLAPPPPPPFLLPPPPPHSELPDTLRSSVSINMTVREVHARPPPSPSPLTLPLIISPIMFCCQWMRWHWPSPAGLWRGRVPAGDYGHTNMKGSPCQARLCCYCCCCYGCWW